MRNSKTKNKIEFSENEYISIRTELIERIKLLNSQSFTVLAAVVSFWAMGLTFKVQILDKIYYRILNVNNFYITIIKISKLFST